MADILGDINDEETLQMRLEIIEKLRTCASEQGLGKASNSLGIGFIIDKEYAKALEAFHQGVEKWKIHSLHYNWQMDLMRKPDLMISCNFINLSAGFGAFLPL